MIDSTQGPNAASGGCLAALTRTHAAYYDTNISSTEWGMNIDRTINLLSHDALKDHFPVRNGKVFCSKPAAVWNDVENPFDLEKYICCGLHTDVDIHFSRQNINGDMLTRGHIIHYDEPTRVDQIFVSAMNLNAGGTYDMSPEEKESKLNLLLKAAYDCTYQAATYRQTKTLILTCIGGGAFQNPLENISVALASSHKLYLNSAGRKSLKKVILPLYEVNSDPHVFVHALNEIGINPVIITHKYTAKETDNATTPIDNCSMS